MRLNERQLRRLIRDIIVESEWNPGDVIKGTARSTTEEDVHALGADFREFDRVSSILKELFPQFDDQKIHDLVMKYQQKKMTKSMSSY